MCSDSCDLNVVLLITQMWFEKVRKGIILLKVSAIGASPCHGGVVKGRCVVMGKPHPSHPFTKPHPTVYEPARTTQKNFQWMKFWQMKNQCLQAEGIHCKSHHMRAFVWDFEGSKGFPKFPMEFSGGHLPGWHHLLRKPFWWRTWFEKFHPRFMSGWRWRFHLTWSFSSST